MSLCLLVKDIGKSQSTKKIMRLETDGSLKEVLVHIVVRIFDNADAQLGIFACLKTTILARRARLP